jgi:hypothetical protein
MCINVGYRIRQHLDRRAAATLPRFPPLECGLSPPSLSPGPIRSIPAPSAHHGRRHTEDTSPGNGVQPGSVQGAWWTIPPCGGGCGSRRSSPATLQLALLLRRHGCDADMGGARCRGGARLWPSRVASSPPLHRLVTRGSTRSFVALPYQKTFRLAWKTMVVSPPPMCAGKCLIILGGNACPEENP